MLRDVMTAAAGVTDRLDVYLVTGDVRAQAMAAEFNFGVIEDTRNESETAAIEMATAWCERQRYDTTVVVPGDIPLDHSRRTSSCAGFCSHGRSCVRPGLRPPRQ